ncbi:MAG: hypothetical protein A2001_18245 [Treponema sp. GWC1_61_84]|nr:MAG: hypothetical protein A2001_18245 [Treponema sp. GWC1_61_84]
MTVCASWPDNPIMGASYHTDTFDKIPEEKRERILRAAAEALGREGISGIRMAEIAKSAGISHGSLFSYFPTKDHLVRAIVSRGADMERERFDVPPSGDFKSILETVLDSAWETASDEEGLISLWLSLSLRENARFADDVLPLERDAAQRWSKLVDTARDEGGIDSRLDPRFVAFLLDAVAAQLMKSRASDLERKKFDLVLPDIKDPAAFIARNLAALLRRE